MAERKKGKAEKGEGAAKKENIIAVEGLSKTYQVKEHKGFFRDLFNPHYKYIHAVNGISFGIGKGEIVGFIGPNGAGKTTTIKMLVGILWPDTGSVVVNGLVPYRHRKKY